MTVIHRSAAELPGLALRVERVERVEAVRVVAVVAMVGVGLVEVDLARVVLAIVRKDVSEVENWVA